MSYLFCIFSEGPLGLGGGEDSGDEAMVNSCGCRLRLCKSIFLSIFCRASCRALCTSLVYWGYKFPLKASRLSIIFCSKDTGPCNTGPLKGAADDCAGWGVACGVGGGGVGGGGGAGVS